MDLQNLNIIISLPEIILFSSLILVLIIDLFIDDKKRYITHILSILTLIFTFIAQIYVWINFASIDNAYFDMFKNDALANFTKCIIYIITFFIFVYSRKYNEYREIYKGEFYLLSLFSVLGMNLMVSANHLLIAYIGLELFSLAAYAVIALRRNNANAVEAGLKYFVLGSLASGIFLYGISFIYGGSGGNLYIDSLFRQLISGNGVNIYLLTFALIFIIVGIAFKLGSVPFHMWVPDVYQGAPTSIAAFLSSAPKIATLIFGYRLLFVALAALHIDWAMILQVIAILSLFVGNLAAIMQTNIKRMLGFSTISHMGFVLLGFSANLLDFGNNNFNLAGFYSSYFYVITYIIMSLAAFAVIIAISYKNNDLDNLEDLSGLNKKHPWYAFAMLLAMFSMAGVPPLMGFYAKFSVIVSLLKFNYTWISVYAVLMSVIGAFYYLRVVKIMYFDDVISDFNVESFTTTAKIVLIINTSLLIIFGIFPDFLLDFITSLIDLNIFHIL